MPQLYTEEKRELYGKIQYSIKRGLLLYYLVWGGALVEGFLDRGSIPSLELVVWVFFILPAVGVAFYFTGAVLNYNPRERFLPKPTMQRKLREYDRTHDKGAEKISRTIDKMRAEGAKQRRDDQWRREAKARGARSRASS